MGVGLHVYITASEGEPIRVNYSASRADQTTSNTRTPPSPSYNGGAHFWRHARQGCKTSAGIKLLIDKDPVNHSNKLCHQSC
jgi:hypothetical protein